MSLRSVVEATWAVWQAHLVRAIALAERVRTASEQAAELAELDGLLDWIAQRAADMPANFRHMLNVIEAERAWAVRDFRTAIHAFDTALRDAGHRHWHRAYIAERSAKFMLAHGLDNAGWSLLVEARAIKTGQEIERMRLANEIAAAAMEHCKLVVETGMSEAQIAAEWEGFVHGEGTGW